MVRQNEIFVDLIDHPPGPLYSNFRVGSVAVWDSTRIPQPINTRPKTS
jgi:hypothetical protein